MAGGIRREWIVPSDNNAEDMLLTLGVGMTIKPRAGRGSMDSVALNIENSAFCFEHPDSSTGLEEQPLAW